MTHRCSICGALWSGVHQCSPVQHVSFRQITGDMISDGEEAVREGRFTTLSQIKTEMQLREEVDQLRADLAATKARLSSTWISAEMRKLIVDCLNDSRGDYYESAMPDFDAAIAFIESLEPHFADPSSAPPPVGNPATPPSGR